MTKDIENKEVKKKPLNIYQKLNRIQVELKAPKNQWNSYSKYNYRSLEDINEGLKPLLDKYELVVMLRDEIVVIGERYYLKAIVTLIDPETRDKIETEALAREEEKKTGMDGSQLTGATSSYARKYAMNAMFAIDDTKDADSRDNKDIGKKKQPDDKKKAARPNSYNNKASTAQPTSSERAECSGCSASITDGVKTFSTQKYGKALCMDCQKKEQAD